MPTVYVVQEPLRRHPNHLGVELKYSLEPAKQYGELCVLLAWSDVRHPINIQRMVTKLREGLQDFSNDDYLLASGNPAAIAAAAMIASDLNDGQVRMLVWDNKRLAYEVLPIDIDIQPMEGVHEYRR